MLGAEPRGATIPEGLVRPIKTAALAEVVGPRSVVPAAALRIEIRRRTRRDETRRSEPVGAARRGGGGGGPIGMQNHTGNAE